MSWTWMAWSVPSTLQFAQERAEAAGEELMRSCEGFIFAYSIVSQPSFVTLQDMRDQVVLVRDSNQFATLVVECKCDLDDARQVPCADGQELARRWDCAFVQTSARKQLNVEKVFCDLVREIRKNRTAAEAHLKPACVLS